MNRTNRAIHGLVATSLLLGCAEEPPARPKTPMSAYIGPETSHTTPRPSAEPPEEPHRSQADLQRAAREEKARAKQQEATQADQDRLVRDCANYRLPVSCRTAGENIVEGRLSEVDGALADQLFTRACNLGDAVGCLHLALLLREGKIVPRSVARSAAVMDQGCQLGYDQLCALAALDLWDGAIEPPDHLAALKALGVNCIRDGAESCNFLAGFMEKGELGPEGVRDAPRYFAKACRLGSQRACEHIDRTRGSAR